MKLLKQSLRLGTATAGLLALAACGSDSNNPDPSSVGQLGASSEPNQAVLNTALARGTLNDEAIDLQDGRVLQTNDTQDAFDL